MMLKERQMMESDWKLFDQWINPNRVAKKILDWNSLDSLFASYDAHVLTEYIEYTRLRNEWDKQLAVYGGDPTHINWNEFRPLRLSREEDWSDWLSFLVLTSHKGIFAKYLFNIPDFITEDYSIPTKVSREEIVEGYRVDLFIKWRNKTFTQLEVKIGDMNLKKTYKAVKALMNKHHLQNNTVTNYILLLSEQIADWQEIEDEKIHNVSIQYIAWDDVAKSLRKSLLSDESTMWKSIAYMFVGAIEQKLIGFHGYDNKSISSEGIGAKIEILREGGLYG